MNRVRVQYQVWIPGAKDGRLVEVWCGACRGIVFWVQPRSGTPLCHFCHPLHPALLQEQIRLRLLDRDQSEATPNARPKRRSRRKAAA